MTIRRPNTQPNISKNIAFLLSCSLFSFFFFHFDFFPFFFFLLISLFFSFWIFMIFRTEKMEGFLCFSPIRFKGKWTKKKKKSSSFWEKNEYHIQFGSPKPFPKNSSPLFPSTYIHPLTPHFHIHIYIHFSYKEIILKKGERERERLEHQHSFSKKHLKTK